MADAEGVRKVPAELPGGRLLASDDDFGVEAVVALRVPYAGPGLEAYRKLRMEAIASDQWPAGEPKWEACSDVQDPKVGIIIEFISRVPVAKGRDATRRVEFRPPGGNWHERGDLGPHRSVPGR